MKKISVITPTYNQKIKYLNCAMLSIINQIYKPHEIILVNDGGESVDPEFLEKWTTLSQNNNISFIYQYNEINGGGAAALNTGINLMTGDYFSWLSSDDYFYPNFLEVHSKLLDLKTGSGDSFYISYCGFGESNYDKDGNYLGSCDYKPVGSDKISGPYAIPQNNFSDILIQCLKNESCIFNGCCFVFHKSVIEKVGLFNSNNLWMADFEYWLRIGQYYNLLVSPQILLTRREHNNRSQFIFADTFEEKRKIEMQELKNKYLEKAD